MWHSGKLHVGSGKLSPKVIVSQNVAGLKQFRSFFIQDVWSPTWFLLTHLPILFILLGWWEDGHYDQPKGVVAALYAARVVGWFLLALSVLPLIFRLLMAQNVPFIIVNFVAVGAWAIATALGEFLFFGTEGLLSVDHIVHSSLPLLLGSINLLFVRSKFHQLGSKVEFLPILAPVSLSSATLESISAVSIADASMLDETLSGRIISLQARNHYIEIRTADGTHLVRMSFQKALERVASCAGVQTHRSWWVSREILVEVRKNGQNFEAVCTAGEVFPVSRPYLAKVQAVVAANSTEA